VGVGLTETVNGHTDVFQAGRARALPPLAPWTGDAALARLNAL
jgi:CxxC motif-containing protein (DUF1111 family)